MKIHAKEVTIQILKGKRIPRATSEKKEFLGENWDTTGFVYGVWALMMMAAFAFVHRYGSNVPFIDDWAMVPYITRSDPVTPQYIWEQHNEHRVPIPKLVLLVLYKLTGGDFRCGMYFNVLVLGALGILMIRGAGRLRGRLSYADAFIPLLLLNWGHYEQILWSIEVQKSLSTFLIGIVFLLILLKGDRLTLKTAFQITLGLVLLPLCGGYGLTFVVFISFWLICVAFARRFSPKADEKRTSLILFGFGLAALGMVFLYFWGYQNRPGSSFSVPNPAFKAIVRTSLEIISMCFGPMTKFLWPFSMYTIFLMLLVASIFLLVIWLKRPNEWIRVLGLLLFIMAGLSLAFGIGKVRAGNADVTGQGYEPRYFGLMVPLMYSIFFLGSVYYSFSWGRLFQVGMVVLISPFYILNTQAGIEYGSERKTREAGFLDSMQARTPIYTLARRYSKTLANELNQKEFADRLQMLKQARIGPYKMLSEGPPLQEINFSQTPNTSLEMEWENGKGVAKSFDAHLTYSVPNARFVVGLKIRIRYHNREQKLPFLRQPWKDTYQDDGSPRLMVLWKKTDQRSFVIIPWQNFETEHFDEERFLSPSADEQTTTIWVDDLIDQFRIYPDYPLRVPSATERYSTEPPPPCLFSISEITLLTPWVPMWSHW